MNSPSRRPYVFQQYITILRKTSIQRIIQEGLNDRNRWGLEPVIYLFIHAFIHSKNTQYMYIKFTCKMLKYIKAAYKYNNLNFMATIILTYSWLKYINIQLLTMWVVIETYWSKTSILTTFILITAHILNNDLSINCNKENLISYQVQYPCFYTLCRKKIVPFFFLGAQCVESGVSCTDCY